MEEKITFEVAFQLLNFQLNKYSNKKQHFYLMGLNLKLCISRNTCIQIWEAQAQKNSERGSSQRKRMCINGQLVGEED